MAHVTSAVWSPSNNGIHTKPLSHTVEEALRPGMFYFSTFNLAEENGYGASSKLLQASPCFAAGSILHLQSAAAKKQNKTNKIKNS